MDKPSVFHHGAAEDGSQAEIAGKDKDYYKARADDSAKMIGETHLVVAALIVTVTFAAGFTLPRGYRDEDGMAILAKKASFKAFVVSETIALMLSVCAVFFHFTMAMAFALSKMLWLSLFLCASYLTMLGMGAMVVAFMTGLYAVLPPSIGLPIVISCCLISCCCILLAGYFISKYKTGDQE